MFGWKKEQPVKKRMVRRQRSGHGWCFADDKHEYFEGGCTNALLANVQFIHQAPRMVCERGYDSTGEAVGDLRKVDLSEPQMAPDANRTLEVIYDRDRRVFHAAGKPDEKIDSADYLLLRNDGTAVAGWK